LWDAFIDASYGPKLLFYRGFMDYHSERFQDFSLLVLRDRKLIGVCPAHRIGDELRCHWGLTYGGLVFENTLTKDDIANCFDAVFEFLKAADIQKIIIKEVPQFYCGETLLLTSEYMRDRARLMQTDKVLAIDYKKPFAIHKTKLKNYRKNEYKGFEIEETSSFKEFWNEVLIPRLKTKYNVEPVHSLDEITLLNFRFPKTIRQFNLLFDGRILAGITLFDKGNAVKSQYGATTAEGSKLRALEYLFLKLIYKFQVEGKSYFSMGTVMDSSFESGFNPGLLKQKQELGCSEYHQHFYTFDIL
jgi:hypothetical protein